MSYKELGKPSKKEKTDLTKEKYKMAEQAKSKLNKALEEKEKLKQRLEDANREKLDWKMQYNEKKSELTNTRKKLKKAEEDLYDARDSLADTQPIEMFDISTLNQENDRLLGKNRKLMKKV